MKGSSGVLRGKYEGACRLSCARERGVPTDARPGGCRRRSSTAGARRLRGLAFIELLVIVAVIAILAAIALPSYNNYTSRYAKCKAGARDGYAIVPLVFGSDRDVLRSDGSRIRFGSAQGELVYGTTDVSVPCRHAMGA